MQLQCVQVYLIVVAATAPAVSMEQVIREGGCKTRVWVGVEVWSLMAEDMQAAVKHESTAGRQCRHTEQAWKQKWVQAACKYDVMEQACMQ